MAGNSENSGKKPRRGQFVKGQRMPGQRPFEKGQSGNPGGRPKDSEFRAACREAAMGLVPHLNTRVRAARITQAQVRAFEAFRDSGGWSPPRQIQHSGPDGGPIQVEEETAFDFSALTDDEMRMWRALQQKAKKKG